MEFIYNSKYLGRTVEEKGPSRSFHNSLHAFGVAELTFGQGPPLPSWL